MQLIETLKKFKDENLSKKKQPVNPLPMNQSNLNDFCLHFYLAHYDKGKKMKELQLIYHP